MQVQKYQRFVLTCNLIINTALCSAAPQTK